MATDFLGQTLNIGDDVIFLNYNGTSANLEMGKITKVFPHAAEIGKKRRAEYKIVKILANIAPVVHGRWATHYRSGTTVAEGYVSTCCDMWNNRKSDYCPNCGAKMGRRADNETN